MARCDHEYDRCAADVFPEKNQYVCGDCGNLVKSAVIHDTASKAQAYIQEHWQRKEYTSYG